MEQQGQKPAVGQPVNYPQEALFPTAPPDYLFKNRQNRTDPSAIVAREYITYVYDYMRADKGLEYKEGEGIFTHYIGAKEPKKGFPFAQAVYAINPTKRLIVSVLRILNSNWFDALTKKGRGRLLTKVFLAFNETADISLSPYYLVHGYYCKTAKEVKTFVKEALLALCVEESVAEKTGEIMAMIFEFDDAYRYRLQDLMSETTQYNLVFNFRGELNRLLKLYTEREQTGKTNYGAPHKIKNFAKVIKIIWFVPSVRKALKRGISSVNFANWQLDAGDIFHTHLYGDYNIAGKTWEQRSQEYKELYGNDESKMPQRVLVKMN